MHHGKVATAHLAPRYGGPFRTLGDVLIPEDDVPPAFYVNPADYERWMYLKGAKRERRVCKSSGHPYTYSEGPMLFPDALDAPSRTVLTGEGGSGASRTKHVVRAQDGRMRRLTPVELERLFGFPDDWTNAGMTDVQRAFCMGNALVVGLVQRIGQAMCAYDSRRQMIKLQEGSQRTFSGDTTDAADAA